MAGVSRSTVSKVINDYGEISEETKKKVKEVIKYCGYAPNMAARILTGKTVETLGLFFLLHQDEEYEFSEDTIVDRMLATVVASAAEAGFLTLTVIIKKMDDEAMENIRDIFSQGRIDGGIFVGAREKEPIIEELLEKKYILGLLDYLAPKPEEPNRIVMNFDPMNASKAVEHLIHLGHRQILPLHGDIRRHDGRIKYQQFHETMKKHGLQIPTNWDLAPGFNSRSTKRILKDFLSSSPERPTAIFCANDHIACGAMEALVELGIDVPGEISLIGIDDALLSRYLQPALTTFRIDFKTMLGILTEKVTEYIRNPFTEPFYRTLEGQLVERDSCKKI